MKTTVVTDKTPRWTGTVDDIVAVANQAIALVSDHSQEKLPPFYSTVTLSKSKIETNYEDLEDFASSTRDNLGQIEKISLTIGEFAEDSPLSTKIEFDRKIANPAVTIRARTQAHLGRGTDKRAEEGASIGPSLVLMGLQSNTMDCHRSLPSRSVPLF
jgi:hypothetical protein